jgi:hypothetical protein
MVYINFYLIHFLLSLVSKDNKLKKIIFLSSLFTFSIVFGLRFNIGADFLGYVSYYNSEIFQWHIGLGYFLSSAVFKFFNFEYYIFNIAITSFSLFLIYCSIKNQNNYALCFFVFLCLYFLGGTLGQIRQTIAMSFILLSFTQNYNFKLKILLITLASLFHYGGLLGFLLLFVTDFHLKNWKKSLVFIFLLMLMIKGISLNFLTDYLVYMDSDKYGGQNNVSIVAIAERLFVLFFCIYNLIKQNYMSKFSFFYIVGFFIFFIYFDIEIISQRLSRFYKFFDIIIIPSMFYIFKFPLKNVFIILSLILLLIKPVYLIKAKPNQYLPMRYITL